MKRLRFVKLIIVPYVVIDDGENLTEFPIEPLEVAGDEVQDFIQGGIQDTFKRLNELFDKSQADDLSDL